MQTEMQVFRNASSGPVDVIIEMYAERYVLQPEDQLKVEAEVLEGHPTFSIVIYDDAIQVYPAAGEAEKVWLNDRPATPVGT